MGSFLAADGIRGKIGDRVVGVVTVTGMIPSHKRLGGIVEIGADGLSQRHPSELLVVGIAFGHTDAFPAYRGVDKHMGIRG